MPSMEDIFKTIETWDDPAAELQKLGIKGERDNCYACPMAQYIIKEAPPEVHSIRVESFETVVTYQYLRVERYRNPEKMSRFITRFDDGEYRDLDEYPEDPDAWGCGCDDCLDGAEW